MRKQPRDRRSLLDIGAAGPLAGFVAAVPCLLVGLLLSDISVVLPQDGFAFGVHSRLWPFPDLPGFRELPQETLSYGSSIVLHSLAWAVFGSTSGGVEVNILIHPIGFAGWLGLFVTCLNLLPLGQLDGGHILYAMFGKRTQKISWLLIPVLIVLGFKLWFGWCMWAGLILFFGLLQVPRPQAMAPVGIVEEIRARFRWLAKGFSMGLSHPPPLYPHIPLDRRRMAIGWVTIVIFVITFIPAPLSVITVN